MADNRGLLTRIGDGFKAGLDEIRGRRPRNVSPVKSVPVASGRTSLPVHKQSDSLMSTLGEGIIKPEYIFEVIPIIRKLTMSNPDVSQAFKNLVYLGNTGHKIDFGPDINPNLVSKMKKHLKDKGKEWGSGTAGIDGLVSKMFAQVAISGAVSVEQIVNTKLTGLDNVVMVNPEYVRFKYKSGRYWPMQKIPDENGILNRRKTVGKSHIKLNPNTFIYYGILGDQDMPYGIPPYLASLSSLETQNFIMDNIKFIVEQVGLMGFLQVMIQKPEQDVAKGETDEKYKARLDTYLDEAVTRVQKGLRNGVNVGFLEETEFKFHSPTKNAGGVADVFREHEMQILSALNMDGALMGRDYTSGFEAVGIIFMKMLSEFVTIQNLISAALERIYTTELTLAGYKFDDLSVEFKRSTLMDELKLQQGKEIAIRNANHLYNMGIINQNQAAEYTGYPKPDQPEPRVQMDLAGGQKQKEKEQDDEKDRKKKKSRRDGSKDSDPDNKTRKKDR